MSRIALSLMLCLGAATATAADGKHLFILSGQSNMRRCHTSGTFNPIVQKEFGAANVIIVKHAVDGAPIRRWYKEWTDAKGTRPEKTGDIYDALMSKVRAAVGNSKVKTVTFIWMQGEADSVRHGTVYEKSLRGLFDQLRTDLKRQDIHIIIGRLSDFGLDPKRKRKFKHWEMVRKIQVRVAEEDENTVWIDTDDLNGSGNALHYVEIGMRTLAKLYAQKSIEMIKKKK